jgi:N6-L-threonylcarbamoyladenine synthase
LNVLGIETSCDETAAAVVKNGRIVLSNVVARQFKVHGRYQGVVPELASRAHVENLNAVVEKALSRARTPFGKLGGIAVTVGPGLVGSLLVGKMAAQSLGWLHRLPCVGVNHLEGHILSALMAHPTLKPPFLSLIVSGGHTELIDVDRIGRYKLLGRTRDDAAGEAYDKVAKMLTLGFPGGPAVDRLAKKGDPRAFSFGRAWLSGTRDFSFSGLKTAVLYKIRELGPLSVKKEAVQADLCAAFQAAVADVLVGKTIETAKSLGRKTLVVGGGVAANSSLRRRMKRAGHIMRLRTLFSPISLCTDNAAMIASAGYYKLKGGLSQRSLSVNPGLQIRSWG